MKEYIPVPTASPIMAAKHIDAAVVKPFTLLLSFNIVPAPKNPIPEIYCPANLNMAMSDAPQERANSMASMEREV